MQQIRGFAKYNILFLHRDTSFYTMDGKRWEAPLSQIQLEEIINKMSYDDENSNLYTPSNEDNNTNCSEVQIVSPMLNNCNDDELMAVAEQIETNLFSTVTTSDADATEEIINIPIITNLPTEEREFVNQNENSSNDTYGNEADSGDSDDGNVTQEKENHVDETTTAMMTPSEKKMLQCQNLREKNRMYREKGKEYKGYKKQGNGQFLPIINRDKRIMLPKCNSNVCKTAKNRHCFEFDDRMRQKIFDKFWSLTWDMKKTYVSTLVTVKKTKRPTVERSKRTLTFEYNLKNNKELRQVCKKTFLNTLGLKEFMVRNWCLNADSGMHVSTNDTDLPLRKRITNERETSIKSLTEFLNSIPKLESHYCRSSSSKLYVEPLYQNKMDLYRVYKTHCQEQRVNPVGPSRFKEEMKKLNISIHSPKKDQCDVCVGHQTGNVEEQEYQIHIKRKTEARDAKAEDKRLAQENPEEIVVMTMDVQAVKLAPFLQASAIYFKTKLCVHNFTIFDLVTKECHCYLWHEAEGGLEANIFATIIFKHLQDYFTLHPRTKRIILYSDGCGYQNRNNCLSNTLLHLATIKNICIEQKYLEKGHTQMEVDATHSLIERKLKNQVIYLPSDYIKFCEAARPSQPFKVHYLNHEYFLNFSSVTYYTTIRPGNRRLDPLIVDIRCLKYDSGEINFKLNYTDDYKLLPNKSKNNTKEITQLYKQGMLKIKQDKWNHLQALKAVLPKDVHYFYDSLQYKK